LADLGGLRAAFTTIQNNSEPPKDRDRGNWEPVITAAATPV